MKEFTFLRHGESTGNLNNILQGQLDFPLTEEGNQQAEKLAAQWAANFVTFDKIFASPQSRAAETAEIIAGALHLSVEYDPIWMERDSGKLSGQPRIEVERQNLIPKFQGLFDKSGDTGESDWEVMLRANRSVQQLMNLPNGKYLIVSHGGLLNRVMQSLLTIAPQANYQGAIFAHANTGVSSCVFNNELHRIEFTSINDVHHTNNIQSIPGDLTFTFVRHGESEGNASKVFQGHSDYPLTQKGIQQAQALGNHYKAINQSFDGIISSPQKRAQQTAVEIGRLLNLPVQSEPLLMEVDNGEYSGSSHDEIAPHYSGFEPWGNLYTPIAKSGESWLEFYNRTGVALQKLMSLSDGHYLITTHSGTINSILLNILGIPLMPSNHTPIFVCSNTSVTQVSYIKNSNRWIVLKHGDTYHLEE